MTRWEYREVVWQPDRVMVATPDPDGPPAVDTYDAADWYSLLARFGADGWELVSCTGTPVGIHEYFFYFKRPLAD